MFQQLGTPSERQLSTALGSDFIEQWHHDRVALWLHEQGWGDLAPCFREHGICGQRFLGITRAQLASILPKSSTTCAQRRKLLNSIRALGLAAAPTDNLKNISINTNLHSYTTLASDLAHSPSLPSAETHSPLLLANNSPATPQSAQRFSPRLKHQATLDCPSFPGSASPMCFELHSPSAHPCCQQASPTRPYSPHAVFAQQPVSPPGNGLPPLINNASLPPTPAAPNFSNHAHTIPSDHETEEAIRESKKRLKRSSSRFSSAPGRLSKIWAASSPWRSPASHRHKPTSNEHAAQTCVTQGSDNGLSTATAVQHLPDSKKDLQRKATARMKYRQKSLTMELTSTPSLSQPDPPVERRIRVTKDKEAWHTLTVTGQSDPDTIKDCVLKRMQLPGHRDHYVFVHENGHHPDIPLSAQAIVRVCSTADHSARERILVLDRAQATQHDTTAPPVGKITTAHPKDPLFSNPFLPDCHDAPIDNTPFSMSPPERGHSPSESASPHIRTMREKSHDSMDNNGQTGSLDTALLCHPLDQQQTPRAVSDGPNKPTPIQPSDLSTSLQETSKWVCKPTAYDEKEKNEDVFEVLPDSAPRSKSCRHSGPVPKRLGTSDLWAVPPRRAHLQFPEFTGIQRQDRESTPTALWDSPQDFMSLHPLQCHPHDDIHTFSDRAPSPPALIQDHEFWGERPPAEVVCQNMDTYFDNHDLDKEIILDTRSGNVLQPTAISPSQRRFTLTKSIRVVAREASQKYNRARKLSTLGAAFHRRKSTKLWDQQVIEVKPEVDDAPSSNPNTLSMTMASHAAHPTHASTATQTMQWIRGRLIGKGSFGRVYLAFNVGTGEVIAVKQVAIPKTRQDRHCARQNDVVDALHREMATLRDLDHDNIVQYLGYGRDDDEGVVHIFLEYVSGGSIASRLMLHGAFEEPLVRHCTRQICQGLRYLHSKGILHRDIKAANILVDQDGVCKISDFGLSKKNDYEQVYDQRTRMSLRGSVPWMAPEVVKNEPYSAKVDIWSLGCTVIEMFTGQRPWLALNQMATLYNLGCHNAPSIPSYISKDANDFLELCFLIDPRERPTAATLLEHPFCQNDPSFDFTDCIHNGKI